MTTLAPKVNPRSMMKLENAYKVLSNLVTNTEAALNAVSNHPELEALLKKLLEKDRQIREMLIAQAEKIVPVNIGGEDVNVVDALNDLDSSVAQLRRTQAKRLAMRLYSLHHPDKGGSVSMFNTIRKAANAGDLETLYYFRLKDGVDDITEAGIKDLQEKIDIKIAQFKGKSAWKIASAHYSGGQNYVKLYTELLEAKIHSLDMQMFGLNTPQNRSE